MAMTNFEKSASKKSAPKRGNPASSSTANHTTVPEPSQVTNNPAAISAIQKQSQDIIANAAKGALVAKNNLAAAKADQAGVIASNTALGTSLGGTTDATGHITPPAGGYTASGIAQASGSAGGVPAFVPTSVTPVVTPDPTPVVTPTPGLLPPSATITPTDLSGMDANSIFASGLAGWGLSDLASGVQGMTAKGLSPASIADWIRSTPSYATRFPAMKGLSAAGHAISESQYLAKEQQDRDLLYTYLGPNAKSYDNPAQLGTLMTNFVSSQELQGRLQAVHDEVNASPDTKAWLQSNYGLSSQDLAAAWLNPQTTADQVAKRSTASQIGGAAATAGFGQLTQAQAELLASQGVTQSQAQNTFAKIGNYGQLEQGLPGADNGAAMSQNSILNASFEGGAPAAQLRQLQDSRLAPFQANGGPVADSSGVVGLRTASVM